MRNFIGKCRLEENLHLTVFSVGLTEVWRRCKSLVGPRGMNQRSQMEENQQVLGDLVPLSILPPSEL